MAEETTTIVILDETFPAIRNETVETTASTALLHGFGESARAVQLGDNFEIVEENETDLKKKTKYKHKCLFLEGCSKSFEDIEELVSHMISEHSINKEHVMLDDFNTLKDFQIWKDHLELDNFVYYTRRNKQDRRFVYYCCRDGQPNPNNNGKGEGDPATKTMLRRTKLSKTLGLSCPSKIIARLLDDGKVEMIFYNIHSHSVSLVDTENHPVPHILKQELFAQFALGASVDDVYEMLHGNQSSTTYPIYKSVFRSINRRRLRKVFKDFQINSNKHSMIWEKIKPSAQIERAGGPESFNQNKINKLVSVQHKLEQLYHLLDESVTQNMLLNYMDLSLAKLLQECSSAFAVSDFKFPLESECLNGEKEVTTSWEEASDILDISEKENSEYSDYYNQGVKRKIGGYDDEFTDSLGDLENSRPTIDPVTGIPNVVIKLKQNRKKLFKVPKRPSFPGLPTRTLDTILRPQVDDTDDSLKISNQDSLKNGKRKLPDKCATTGDVTSNFTSSNSATEVLQELQGVNQKQTVESASNNIEASANSQLLEIVNLAKALVEDENTNNEVILDNNSSVSMEGQGNQ